MPDFDFGLTIGDMLRYIKDARGAESIKMCVAIDGTTTLIFGDGVEENLGVNQDPKGLLTRYFERQELP